MKLCDVFGLGILLTLVNSTVLPAQEISPGNGRDFRQLAVIDHQRRVAAWTGEKCIKDAGHTTGDNFSVQANLMLNDKAGD